MEADFDTNYQIIEYFKKMPFSESAALLKDLQKINDEVRGEQRRKAWVEVCSAFQKYLDLIEQKDLSAEGYYIDDDEICCGREFHVSLDPSCEGHILLETKQ